MAHLGNKPELFLPFSQAYERMQSPRNVLHLSKNSASKVFTCTFLPLQNVIEVLVIDGGNNVVFMGSWPSKQKMIGHMSVNDMKASGCSNGSHRQVDIDIRSVNVALSPKLDTLIACSILERS